MKAFYNKYFGKDKSLRHYTQHLFIALAVFLMFSFFVFKTVSVLQIILYFLFTYLIDLDFVITLLISKRNLEFKKEISKLIKARKFEQAMIYATKNHKKIDNLIIHNFLFYGVFSIVLILSILNNYITLGYIFLALVTHMTFDIFDDLKNLGHLKHWKKLK